MPIKRESPPDMPALFCEKRAEHHWLKLRRSRPPKVASLPGHSSASLDCATALGCPTSSHQVEPACLAGSLVPYPLKRTAACDTLPPQMFRLPALDSFHFDEHTLAAYPVEAPSNPLASSAPATVGPHEAALAKRHACSDEANVVLDFPYWLSDAETSTASAACLPGDNIFSWMPHLDGLDPALEWPTFDSPDSLGPPWP